LGVGDQIVQWVEYTDDNGNKMGYFYRPMDHADTRRSFHVAVPVMLRQTAHFRRNGSYSAARGFLNAARWFRLEAAHD
jgi:hypothetical protein